MQDWLKITLFLCLFGTLREIRPSEPFVTEFLLGEWRNITNDQLSREVYPVGTYSYFALLVVVFLITDFLRFKPVIILSGLSGIAVYAVLLWTTSIEWLQVSQFLYGLYMATEVAYLTYIYAKVPSAKYPLVSSYTRVAALAGRFLSGVSSQLLTYFGIMDYRDLNYITFTAQILATFWALWLPSVPYGIYFHRRSVSEMQLDTRSPDKHVSVAKRPLHRDAMDAGALIVRHASAAYARPRVVAWSLLYAAALALFVQVQTYMQVLWAEIMRDTGVQMAYNGYVEAALTLLGAGAALAAARVRLAPLPAPAAAVQALAVFAATYAQDLLVSYAGYVVMGMLFHYTITLASAKIASELSDESCFGLIFGINTLAGTGLQALLTFILLQQLQFSISAMYFTISGLYLLLAASWLTGCIINYFRKKRTAL